MIIGFEIKRTLDVSRTRMEIKVFKNVTNSELNKMVYFMKMRYNKQENENRKEIIGQIITKMEMEITKRLNKNGDK